MNRMSRERPVTQQGVHDGHLFGILRVAEAVDIIGEYARTGQHEAGWIYVSGIDAAIPVGGLREGDA